MRPSATGSKGRNRAVLAALLFATPFLTAPAGPAPRSVDGALIGTVTLNANPGPAPAMLSPYARPRYRPPARSDASTSPEAVVVYLRGDAPVASPPRPAEIVQRNRTILPHVTAIEVGARVAFPNEDDVFHNLFSLSSPHRFNLGRYPPGESRSEVFERPGVVRLFCDIHSEMGAVILVVDTPYFTSPDASGDFRLAGVPAGEYTAIFWHELAGTDSTRVVIRDGAETRLDFTLGR